MKKIAVFLLILVIFLPIVVVHADSTKELTCQGIPWFSTPEEASSILFNAGFISKEFGENDINKGTQTRLFIKKKGYPYLYSSVGTDPEDKDYPYTYISEKNPTLTRKLQAVEIRKLPKTIAGAKVSSFYLYFTPEAEDRQLVECKITFKDDKSYDRDKIIEALETAYGKRTTVKIKYVHLWVGVNNTIVIFNSKLKNVTFATIDGLNLAEAYDVEIPETSETVPEDTGF